MSTLIELNQLRVQDGQKPLKSWKESKAKLLEQIEKLKAKRLAIDDMQHAVEDDGDSTNGDTPSTSVFDEGLVTVEAPDMCHHTGGLAEAEIKPQGEPKREKRKVPADSFTLAELARQHGKKEKVVRQSARPKRSALAPMMCNPLPMHHPDFEWRFRNDQKTAVEKVLEGVLGLKIKQS